MERKRGPVAGQTARSLSPFRVALDGADDCVSITRVTRNVLVRNATQPLDLPSPNFPTHTQALPMVHDGTTATNAPWHRGRTPLKAQLFERAPGHAFIAQRQRGRDGRSERSERRFAAGPRTTA